jgi:hypothetical protein
VRLVTAVAAAAAGAGDDAGGEVEGVVVGATLEVAAAAVVPVSTVEATVVDVVVSVEVVAFVVAAVVVPETEVVAGASAAAEDAAIVATAAAMAVPEPRRPIMPRQRGGRIAMRLVVPPSPRDFHHGGALIASAESRLRDLYRFERIGGRAGAAPAGSRLSHSLRNEERERRLVVSPANCRLAGAGAADYHHAPRLRPPTPPAKRLISQISATTAATMKSQWTVKPTPKAMIASSASRTSSNTDSPPNRGLFL